MKIELRRVTHNERLSEETSCFAADIYIDGVKVGDVKNDGHGGPDHIHPHALAARLEAYAKTLPKIDCSDMYSPEQAVKLSDADRYMESSADIVISDLLNAYLAEKRLKRMVKTKLVIVRGGKCYTVGPFKAAGFERDPAVVAKYVKDGDLCLNTLPLPKAVEALRAAHG